VLTLHGSNYSTSAGSTIITLHASYLDTLDNGTYAVRVVFLDGYADGLFTVNVTGTPKTGDGGNMMLWIILGLSSILVALCLLVWRKRRERKTLA